ncbi:hypothetical protein M0R88_07980 [Halorussus gelatinilyticus]|uniref:Uncharacterized protein n=1 Tax=Halorussus gelatinilyticus TaxID=2937524 RepID=A0A8U0INI9_9EURY|nr:hypothetical protein [Halorussus gelatinilyticus]UPW02022.1 hypothetical protein M0R88_07980 [Halorussus gelatinilyticus]
MTFDAEPFTVAVKESAREASEPARRLATIEGDRVTFDSETEAHRRARELSAEGESVVKVQRAAPQDPDDVDGYLVGWPQRRHQTPDGSPAEGLTFDTEANQYGALGEAVVLTPEVNPPLLTHFARVDADLGEADADGDAGDVRVELDTDPDPVTVGSDRRWEPDCRAVVRLGPDRPVLTEYFCEVKAGDGSFERSQREAMRAKAREATVLKIRVDLDDLPDSYTAWVRTVAPEGDGEGETHRVNASLDSF